MAVKKDPFEDNDESNKKASEKAPVRVAEEALVKVKINLDIPDPRSKVRLDKHTRQAHGILLKKGTVVELPKSMADALVNDKVYIGYVGRALYEGSASATVKPQYLAKAEYVE